MLTYRQAVLTEALGSIAGQVPLEAGQAVSIAAILDQLYAQANRKGYADAILDQFDQAQASQTALAQAS